VRYTRRCGPAASTVRVRSPGHGIGPAHGYPAISVSDGMVLRAAFGSVLYLALIALLSLGAATALREAAVAIGAVLGLLYVLPVIAVFTGNAALSGTSSRSRR
jgi:ABC-2 type transport system permease protein